MRLALFLIGVSAFAQTAIIKTNPHPTWGNTQTWRVGSSNGLDGSASSGGWSGYNWSCTSFDNGSGATTCPLMFSSTTVAQPTVTGVIRGDFTIQLCDGMNAHCGTAHVGAVPMDANGVVTNSSDVTTLFGPMIALGFNPWGFADEREYAAIPLQTAYLQSRNYNPPEFITKGAGTIAYKYGGNLACTTLSAGITSTSTTIPVTNASCLNLTAFPTDILVENELIRISAASATSGAANLTVAFDGRGAARGSYSYSQGLTTQYPAAIHSMGAGIGDEITVGTSTLFATDSSRPICPGGVPGLPGPVIYSTGTVTLSAGSSTLTGSGTTFTSGMVGDHVMVAATHSSASFTFMAVITAFTDTTHVTLSRPAPTGVDASAFTFKILGPVFYSPEATIPSTSSLTQVGQDVQICESETRLSTQVYFGAGTIFGTSMGGVKYSYKTALGATSFTFQPQYYCTGCMGTAMWLRSGLIAAKAMGDNINPYWVNDPEVGSGFLLDGTFGIRMMGGFLGGVVDKVTNPSTTLSWDHLRHFGTTAALIPASGNCSYSDTRDTGSGEAVVSLLALFDTAQQSTWNGILYSNPDSWYVWDQACKSLLSTNSWANGFYSNPNGPTVTLTNGSASVIATVGTFANDPTANNGTSGLTGGTGTCTAGSDVFTRISGTFPTEGQPPGTPPNVQIAITGTRLGSPFTLYASFRNDTANQLTLTGKWPSDADSGTCNWTGIAQATDGNYNVGGFAVDAADTAGLAQNFILTYVDSTHATLNRPWPLANSSMRHYYSANISGAAQQPFMLGGAKSMGLDWAAKNANATIAAAFQTLLWQAADWEHDTGVNAALLGPNYCRVTQTGEPQIAPSTGYLGAYAQANCQYGLNPASVIAARELTGETPLALAAYYASQGNSPAAKLWADQQYGALWGSSAYNTGGVYQDANSGGNNIGLTNLTDAYMGSYKWTGFFLGMGMAHSWPAIRLGATPPIPTGSQISGRVTITGNAILH